MNRYNSQTAHTFQRPMMQEYIMYIVISGELMTQDIQNQTFMGVKSLAIRKNGGVIMITSCQKKTDENTCELKCIIWGDIIIQ